MSLPILIRIPSYTLGNTGDAALITTLKQHLNAYNSSVSDNKNIAYKCPMKKIRRHTSITTKRYRGMVYFGNDCLAYYNLDTALCKAFLNAGKPVLFINSSFGPSGTTKNDAILQELLQHPLCHLIARDQLSYNEITQRLQPHNPVTLSADLAFSINLDSENAALLNSDVAMLDDTPLQKWWRIEKRAITDAGGYTLVVNLHSDFGNEDNNKFVINSVQNALASNDTWMGGELRAGRLAVIFLSHDSRKPETVICSEVVVNIRKALTKEKNTKLHSRLIVCPCLDPVKELVMLRDGVDAVLTGRMHLSILSMRVGVPATAIAYNGIKAKGTFGHFGGILESQGVLTAGETNVEKVDNIVRNMLVDSRKEYLDCINTALPRVSELALTQIQKIKHVFA